MNRVVKYCLCILMVSFLTTRCGSDCEDQSEPTIDFRFYTFIEDDYYNLYPPYYKTSALVDNKLMDVNSSGGYPMSLLSDTMIFIFTDTTEAQDTLAFSYKRNFDFESQECGITVRFSSFKMLPFSTFDKADFNIVESQSNMTLMGRKEDKSNYYYVEIFY